MIGSALSPHWLPQSGVALKESKTRAMARTAGWPFPVRPASDAPIEVRRTWARLYKRLRWALGHEVDLSANLRPGAKLARLRREARLRGVEVTLTRGEYEALLLPGLCTYCGAALPTSGHAVDRVDSTLGYTRTNVVAACDTCNRVKADIFTFQQMTEIGQLLRRWRAEGRWSDPARRRPGGRPRLGDLRQEIETWNNERAQRRLALGERGSGQA